MRDIKFRAWNGKKMFHYPDWSTLHMNTCLVFEDGHNYVDESDYDNKLELMQYTGLKDKNGKEIYEGDIVRDSAYSSIYLWEVYYDEDDAKFWCKNENTHEGIMGMWNAQDDPAYPNWDKYEVIGNIHEHSHLLEVTKQP